MAITTGYGLKPVQLIGGQAFSGGTMREFVVTPGNNTTPYGVGSLITIAAGVAKAVATSPVAIVGQTTTTNQPVGVMTGCRYTDPVLKQTQHGPYLPADTTGYANIFVKVVDDPDCLFQVRYEGTLTYTSIGSNVALAFGTTSATTGNCKDYAVSVATTLTLGFRIVDIIAASTDSAGAAVTDIIVKYNANVHAYNLQTGQ
jgi:hypothetical protein